MRPAELLINPISGNVQRDAGGRAIELIFNGYFVCELRDQRCSPANNPT